MRTCGCGLNFLPPERTESDAICHKPETPPRRPAPACTPRSPLAGCQVRRPAAHPQSRAPETAVSERRVQGPGVCGAGPGARGWEGGGTPATYSPARPPGSAAAAGGGGGGSSSPSSRGPSWLLLGGRGSRRPERGRRGAGPLNFWGRRGGETRSAERRGAVGGP